MILCALSEFGCSVCNHPDRTRNVSTCPVYQETRVCLFYEERHQWPEPCSGINKDCPQINCFFRPLQSP